MAFEVHDYYDLVRLLGDHPEWRAELRRLLLTDELLELPAIVRELAEAQRRTEEKVEALAEAQRRTEEKVEALAEAQQRTEERLGRVEEQMAAMAEAQRGLAEAQQRTEQHLAAMAKQVESLAQDLRRVNDKLGDFRGTVLEWKYRNNPGAYFGSILRRVRVVNIVELEETLEARLTPDEEDDVRLVDLIARGRPSRRPQAPQVYLAVEISGVVDRHDIERARRRANLLRKAGYRAIPVVAGEQVTLGAEDQAKDFSVPLMQDGQVLFWEQALARWLEPRNGEQFDEAT
jgi:anion-transporting  ArsA/GET3 family ATPase